jgi:hypothetical protein
MLFKSDILERIANGQIKLAFRKWTKPTVKSGGTLLTAAGQLRIKSVAIITYEQVSDKDVSAAGYESRDQLNNELNRKERGELYRISFELEQEDPRIALRENASITDDEWNALTKKIDRLDKNSKFGPWTTRILTLIREQPELHAVRYANKLKVDKDWLKINIRKLKALGLTISHPIGYSISPRGAQYLKMKERNLEP